MYMIRKLWPDRWVQKATQYLFLILFAVGISVNNTVAIFDAIGGSRNEFLRTPKFGIIKRGEDWKNNEYTLPFTRTTLLEIFFALYGCIATAISLFTGNFIFTPIIVLQTAGFSYIAYFSMTHSSFNNNKHKINRQNILPSYNKTSVVADSAGFRVKCTDSINITTSSKGKIVGRVARPNYYYNGSYRNYNNKDLMSAINRRLVLFGILGFFLLGAALAFYGYEKTIYPIDRAVGYLSRAQSAQTPQAVGGYLQSAVALLPKDGNPVWIFPNPGTDFILIQKELDSMILRTRYISVEEPNGAAYNTGLQDLRDSIKIIETNLQEANPYLYISITNIFLGSVWIFVIIFIFAVLRRGRSKIKEYETP
jgi:hypothetical protein